MSDTHATSHPPVHDPMRDPVVDPVLEPVTDVALDPETDPAARTVTPAGEADPVVVEAVVDIRNRFGVSGLTDMVRLAEGEIAAARRALEQLGPG